MSVHARPSLRIGGRTGRALVAVVLLAGAVGAVVAATDGAPARPHLSSAVAAAPTDGSTLSSSTVTPSPAATAGTPTSQVYPFRPTELTLPSGVVAAVDPAGVGSDGSLLVPPDPSRVGWWDGGALVDEPYGSVVLAGHLDSLKYGIGVMVELHNLRVGDEVVVGDADQQQRFRVTGTESVPKAELAGTAEAFRQDVPHRLVLITCTGPYDKLAHTYPENLVVIATPMP